MFAVLDSSIKEPRKTRIDRILRRRQRKALKASRKSKRRGDRKKHGRSEYNSRVFEWLNDYRFAIPPSTGNKMLSMKVPRIFCFSRNPDESISFLRKLYGAILDITKDEIFFDHSKCQSIGVCASTIMDIILVEGKKWRASINKPIVYGGKLLSGFRLSETPEADKLLKVSGILEHLGISHANYQETELLSLITNGESSIIAEKVIEYINRALHRQNLTLTSLGNNYFGKLLGEIADNCAQHGGPKATWYTLGHYSYDNEKQIGICRLVILDFGQTIYDGLKNSSASSVQKRLIHYVKRTNKLFKRKEKEETLYTLFALQQRASRFASNNNAVRGNGTIVFLDAFQNLFDSEGETPKSVLSITSGKCSILFDGTYRLQECVYSGGYTNKIIAFNRENKLTIPPDRRYVRTIDNGFPGTVISIELHISDNLISRKEQQNGPN